MRTAPDEGADIFMLPPQSSQQMADDSPPPWRHLLDITDNHRPLCLNTEQTGLWNNPQPQMTRDMLWQYKRIIMLLQIHGVARFVQITIWQ